MTGLTPEQLELRRSGIGSSEIGVLAGVSPYSAIDVWRSKVEGYVRPDNPDMERGRFLEPAVADWYAFKRECRLTEPGTLRRDGDPFVIATPDRLALGADNNAWTVELKTSSRSEDNWGAPGTDEVPMHYLSQVQWELLVTGHSMGELAVLNWGRTLDIYTIHADADLQRSLVHMAKEWWDKHVKTATPPPPDASDEYTQWLKAKYPRNDRPMLEAPPGADGLARLFLEQDALAAKHEAEAEVARQKLKGLIGDAEGLVGQGWVATWKADKNGKRTFRLKEKSQ